MSTNNQGTQTYNSIVAGVQEEVGGVGCHGRLVRYWSMAQCHANDGCHVGLCAKDVDGDTSGLTCRGHGYNYGSETAENIL